MEGLLRNISKEPSVKIINYVSGTATSDDDTGDTDTGKRQTGADISDSYNVYHVLTNINNPENTTH